VTMDGTRSASPPGFGARGLAKNRIEALADGIFGVAMTLLVLDVKSPAQLSFETTASLLSYLGGLRHSFAMYAISFVVLGMFWFVHHLQFHFVRHVDRRLLWTNLAFLMFVALVPFSTDLYGDHGHLQLPSFVYGANLLVLALLLYVHLHHLAGHPDLASEDLGRDATRQMRRQLAMFTVVPTVSIAASFYSPRLSMYLYALLALPAFVPGRIDRITRARGDPPSRLTEHP